MTRRPPSLFRPVRLNHPAAFLTAAIGVLAMVGWTFGVEVLKRVLPGLAAMNPASAICFVLAAVSLALIPEKSPRSLPAGLTNLARVCAGLVIMVGAAQALAFLGGPDLRIDQILFASDFRKGLSQRALMAPLTALNFFLIGNALILLHSPRRRGSPLVSIAALVAGFQAIVAVLGYLYGVGAFYGLTSHIPMALHTAVGFLVLAFGILDCQSRHGLLAAIGGNTVGGKMARRLLPAVILVPAILGWFRVEAVHRGFFGEEFGVALYTVINMLVFSILVTSNA
ncbi:MAG TPA: hypothetical protein VK474_11765, partial [Chthoniobacterales bacterium]|nr:hypothetical protein [Chthoniobacterales bacterium]